MIIFGIPLIMQYNVLGNAICVAAKEQDRPDDLAHFRDNAWVGPPDSAGNLEAGSKKTPIMTY